MLLQNMKKVTEFARKLAANLQGGLSFSKSQSPLFFENTSGADISDRFVSLFAIKDKDRFNDAFKIAADGLGKERGKINSVASSALLPLLVFHPLFSRTGNDSRPSITIGDKEYDRAFFEVRNRVVRRASCVDIVLQSVDKKTLLFLESKLTEYIGGTTRKATYGKGYIPLYSDYRIQAALNEGNIEASKTDRGVVLSAQEKTYIEGIKQSVSHLIGIVKGPAEVKSDINYPLWYQSEYRSAYSDATEFIYGTIIYNPCSVGVGMEEYDAYMDLYKRIFSNSPEIMAAIHEYCGTNCKPLTVLDTPLTYQEILSDNKTFINDLSAVKNFYYF